MEEKDKKQTQKSKEKKQSDKRRHARFPILEYALIYTEESPGPTRALIVDISLGGAQVRSRKECQQGESCIMQIGRDDSSPLEVPASIRYCFPIEGQDLFAIGLQFSPRTKKEKTGLVNYVHGLFLSQGENLLYDTEE